MKKRLRTAAVMVPIAVWFLLGGCLGSDPASPATGSVRGQISELSSGAGVPDAIVVLIEPGTVRPATCPVYTGSSGEYVIRDVDPGYYSLVVFHGNLVTFDRTSDLVTVTAGSESVCDVRLADSGLWDGTGYKIAGTVRDASTGEPVSRAYVEGWSWAYMDVPAYFYGYGLPEWTITDDDGSFVISSPLCTCDSPEPPWGLIPLVVTREGYEPFMLVGSGDGCPGIVVPPFLPVPEGDDSTLAVTIDLRPLASGGAGPHGAGAIRGRASFLGASVAGVRVVVSVESVVEPDTLHPERAAAPVPGATTITGADGEFLVGGLVPGDYRVHAAYLLNDGYVKDRWQDAGFSVADAETTQAGDVAVLLAIEPIYPADRSVIAEARPVFRWEAVPDTAGCEILDYRLTLGIDEWVMEHQFDDIAQAQWQLPEALALSPGDDVKWTVQARAVRAEFADTLWIADTERYVTFTCE